MVKLWQVAIAELASRWSSPFGWVCADMYVWICDIPRKGFARREFKWICGAKSCQKRSLSVL